MRHPVSSTLKRRILIYGPSLSKGFGHKFTLGFMQGIGQFARQRPHWNVVPVFTLDDKSRKWDGDGAIVQQPPPHLSFSPHTKVIRVGTAKLSQPEDGVVRSDNYQIGVMAADHLSEMGFQHFAYFGRMRVRGQGFHERLLEKGITSRVWVEDDIFLADQKQGFQEEPLLCDWLKGLPIPVAIFAQTDIHAQRIIQAAQTIGRSIPEEIAILGVDNDETLCNLSAPPLSSIEQPVVQIGYRAAQMLDQLMEGETPTSTELVLPPVEVKARKTTGRYLDVPPLVRSALSYLQEHFQQEVLVAEMSKTLGASRRTVERAFREHIGHTILDELTGLRLSQARESLRSTSWTMDEVAENAGFQSLRQFHDTFKRHSKMTPAKYRQKFQMN